MRAMDLLLSLADIFEIIFKMLYKSTSKLLIILKTLNEEPFINHLHVLKVFRGYFPDVQSIFNVRCNSLQNEY